MKEICKWLACNIVKNFECESEDIYILGYDMNSCVACFATHNENGVPICHLISFNDDWDDESIEACKYVSMSFIPFPLVPSVDNAYKLFSMLIDSYVTTVWLGCQNYGFNAFNADFEFERVLLLN